MAETWSWKLTFGLAGGASADRAGEARQARARRARTWSGSLPLGWAGGAPADGAGEAGRAGGGGGGGGGGRVAGLGGREGISGGVRSDGRGRDEPPGHPPPTIND